MLLWCSVNAQSFVHVKSISITEHLKTSYKSSKTIRQAEKVGSNGSLYSDTKKAKNV